MLTMGRWTQLFTVVTDRHTLGQLRKTGNEHKNWEHKTKSKQNITVTTCLLVSFVFVNFKVILSQ